MFWWGEPCKATWLCDAHRWGQKTRCLLTALGEAVLCQEMGNVVLISPTFSQTDLFLSLDEYLIIRLWGTKKMHPRKFGLSGSSCMPAFLSIPLGWTQRWDRLGWETRSRKEKHDDSFRMWRFAAHHPPPLQNPQCQGNFNQVRHLES